MVKRPHPIYVPTLRQKLGEMRGLYRLQPDVIGKILPRIVVPPPHEWDPEKQGILTKDEIVYQTGRKIARHWPMREYLLDVTYLFQEFGDVDCALWLQRLFSSARNAAAKPIPVASLSDLIGAKQAAYKQIILSEDRRKIAIKIDFADVDQDLNGKISLVLSGLEISADQCIVLVDFAEADFSDVVAVAGIARGVLQTLQDLALWHQVVFQGTNYPDVNPADPGSSVLIPRNEWHAWKHAIDLDFNTSDHLIFGDYGADCARFVFPKKGGGIPIRHYRYTTADSWMVVRGRATGDAKSVMKDVCARILYSGKFAGQAFSLADKYIFETAKGTSGPGNGTTWREINTAHHITRVVRDIGIIKGMSFADINIEKPAIQQDMFEEQSGR